MSGTDLARMLQSPYALVMRCSVLRLWMALSGYALAMRSPVLTKRILLPETLDERLSSVITKLCQLLQVGP
eukprot:159038-Rhodomonas_salina.1